MSFTYRKHSVDYVMGIGFLVISLPQIILTFGGAILFYIQTRPLLVDAYQSASRLGKGPIEFAFVLLIFIALGFGFAIAGGYWCLVTAKWRIWAFSSVLPGEIEELREQAITAQLIYPRGHKRERWEWRTQRDQARIDALDKLSRRAQYQLNYRSKKDREKKSRKKRNYLPFKKGRR